MTAGLRPYPDYKDSGLPWCPRVPSHWGLKPNRAFLRQRKVLVGERHPEYTLLSLTKRGIIIRDLTDNRGKFSADMGTSQEVRPGDLVMCLFDVPETPRTVGLSAHYGMITGAYTVFAPRDEAVARWLEAFYIAMDDRKLLSPLYSGLRKTIPRPTFLGTKTPIPPPDEQRSIVGFLHNLGRKVDRFIRNRRRLIEVLNEQKQAIINRAVTRGLDPNVPLKPSGIDWLGEIPRHWQTRRLKHLLSQPLKYGANAAAELADRSLPRYIRITDIDKDGQLIDERFRSISPELAEPYMLRDGDILLARSGATVGKAFLYTAEAGLAAHAGYLIKARVNRSRILPEFLYAVLQSARYWRWIASMTIQATIQNVNAEKYANLWVTVPSLSEQREILDAINRDAAVLSDLIHKAKREIDLIREYRTRLIADVVTGKLDVRHLSPAEIPADEITEEPAEGIDGEEPEVEEAELVEEAADADD